VNSTRLGQERGEVVDDVGAEEGDPVGGRKVVPLERVRQLARARE
jgi:hypothetical protein